MPRKAGDAETSMFTRGRIIGMYEGGVPKMMISKKLNIDPKTIRKWILRYEAHGEPGLKSIPKPGAHRKTTAFEDVAIAQAVAVTPTITPQELNKMLGLNISAHTIRRRVRDAKLRSRMEKKESRLAKKKSKTTGAQTNSNTSEGSTTMDSTITKRKSQNAKKPRKKKEQVQQPQQQQPSQPQPALTQMQPAQTLNAMAVQHDGTTIQLELKHTELTAATAVPLVDPSTLHQQFHMPKVEEAQQEQQAYQPKQMPSFYGFGATTGYEFPRIWTPMTNVNVRTATYCDTTPKLSTYTTFGPAEVPQVTHSGVQTTGFINASVTSPN